MIPVFFLKGKDPGGKRRTSRLFCRQRGILDYGKHIGNGYVISVAGLISNRIIKGRSVFRQGIFIYTGVVLTGSEPEIRSEEIGKMIKSAAHTQMEFIIGTYSDMIEVITELKDISFFGQNGII